MCAEVASSRTAGRTASTVDDLLAEYDSADACIADLICDRHDPADVAFVSVRRREDGTLGTTETTYGRLRQLSEHAAGALAALGVREGDSVATLMGKSVSLVAVMLGAWRLGASYVPLFTAFAWPAIEMRLEGASARVVVCDPGQRSKIRGGEATVVVAGDRAGAESILEDGDLVLSELTRAVEESGADAPAAVAGGADATMAILYTSGTTGRPKGVVIPTRAIASFHQYMEVGLDVTEDDVFWNAADPGWAYGLYYGLIGPMAIGVPNVLLEAQYSPELALRVIDELGVTNFAAAPTVYRTLRAYAGDGQGPQRLRCASSAGEPLTPEIGEWSRRFFGADVRDHYGQTEHGMFIVNPWHPSAIAEIAPGAMGRSLPGWSCAVLDPIDDAALDPAGGTTDMGRVAIDMSASRLRWFVGYLDAPEKTAERFSEDTRWYYTGDAGKLRADGTFFFASRDDDVIIMAGYRIGPFDVESVLVGDPDVVEAAVIGVRDELRGEVLEAYVVLKSGVPAGDDEAAARTVELQNLVKTEFAAHAYPRRIHFVDDLPKTPSGKIQRFLLRRERAAELEG